MADQPPRFAHFFLLLLLAFVWGSSFILMKRALFDVEYQPLFSAGQVAAMRMVTAGLVLSPIAFIRMARLKRSEWGWIFAVGVLGNAIPAFLFAEAQLKLASSMAGMLNALTPLFTLLVGMFLFSAKYRSRQKVGLLIGFAGASGLILSRSGGGEVHVMSGLMVVLATICYAFSVNIIRHRLQSVATTTIAAIALLMMALPYAIWLMSTDVVQVVAMNAGALNGLVAVVILGAIGTAAALVVFNRIIRDTGALFASSVTYVIPIFAAMWGGLDGELLTWWHGAMAAVVLSGVYLVIGSPKKV